MRLHTRALAHDSMEGRGAGRHGERMAADYIVDAVRRLSLRPVPGTDDFRLPVPLYAESIDPSTSLELTGASEGPLRFRHGDDFIVNTGGRAAFVDMSGPLVYLGDPAAAARNAETPVRDRVVVLDGVPGGAAVTLMPRLRAAGARGVVVLVPDANTFALYVRSRGTDRFVLDADVDDPVWQPSLPVILAGPTLSTALARASEAGAARTAPTVSLDLVSRRTVLPTANVAAMIPGTDPTRSDEYVVYTAHYDHLGISTPDAAGDSIYNGFSDNAAGVAMLLAIAQSLSDSPLPTPVMFLFLAAEERGLLGASHLAAHPPFPLERIRALINLDAGAPPVPPVSWRIAGGTASTLGPLAQQVAARHEWDARLSDASPNSDYWPFLARGVPAIFIIPGDAWEDTTPEERDALRRRWDRYHQAGDEYHPDFPFSGLLRYAEYAREVGVAAATAPLP